MFYGDTDNIKAFKERCDKYDMPNVLTIPNIVNSSIYHPLYIWEGPETRLCLINHWLLFHFNTLHSFRSIYQDFLRLMRSAAIGFAIFLITLPLRRYILKSTIVIIRFLKQVLKEGLWWSRLWCIRCYLCQMMWSQCWRQFWKNSLRMVWQLFKMNLFRY